MANSAELNLKELIVIGPVPILLRVTVCAALATLSGDRLGIPWVMTCVTVP
jgi:hypothetical protein